MCSKKIWINSEEKAQKISRVQSQGAVAVAPPLELHLGTALLFVGRSNTKQSKQHHFGAQLVQNINTKLGFSSLFRPLNSTVLHNFWLKPCKRQIFVVAALPTTFNTPARAKRNGCYGARLQKASVLCFCVSLFLSAARHFGRAIFLCHRKWRTKQR